jgi:hypothetical protein
MRLDDSIRVASGSAIVKTMLFAMVLILSAFRLAGASASGLNPIAEIGYQNVRDPKVPWSIHVVRVPRREGAFELHSMHAEAKAVGLSTVTDQTRQIDATLGIPVGAMNGDFYERDGHYAGDPRGLQILNGELISAPSGTPSFWIDALGEAHTGETRSQMRISWPDGSSTPIGLNGFRQANSVELYTMAAGPSTRTRGGREIVLEQLATDPWLPLRPSRTYHARVREIREGGNTPIAPATMVLSIGPSCRIRENIQVGSELVILTTTEPNLRGVKTAISGGPVLVRDGKRQRVKTSDSDSYEFSSMSERHPRSAIGWNQQSFFLVVVDGRQRGVSAGMTLDEFGSFLSKLGCDNALNLDGGGSATLWYNGKVQNRPCDGYEREIANSLVVLKKKEPKSDDKPAAAASNIGGQSH